MSNKRTRKFKNESSISKYLYCPICLQIFRKAVFVSCMHTFCKHCIVAWKINRRCCPVCKIVIKNDQELKPNLIVNSLINELEVKCIAHKD